MLDKRGRLSAALVAKDPIRVPRAGALVLPAANDAAADEAPPPAPPPPPAEPVAAEEVLVVKGGANASGFRPIQWSFERRPAPVSPPEPVAEPARIAAPPLAPAAAPLLPDASRGHSKFIAALCWGGMLLGVMLLLHIGGAMGPAHEASPPPQSPAPAAAPPPPNPHQAEADQLVARGEALLATGDIVSARLFFERAAEFGSARAALMAGETYDTAFLDIAGVRGMAGDANAAAFWYRRAKTLGDPSADELLSALRAR